MEQKLEDVRESNQLVSSSLKELIEEAEEKLYTRIEEIHGKTPEQLAEEKRMRETLTLSMADRRRVTELTDFYKHLSQVIESLIEKFSNQERIVNGLVLKQ